MVLKKFVLSYSLSGLNKLEGKNDLKTLKSFHIFNISNIYFNYGFVYYYNQS